MADFFAQEDDENVRLLAGWAVAAVARQVASAASRMVRIRMTLAPRLLPGVRGVRMVGAAGSIRLWCDALFHPFIIVSRAV